MVPFGNFNQYWSDTDRGPVVHSALLIVNMDVMNEWRRPPTESVGIWLPRPHAHKVTFSISLKKKKEEKISFNSRPSFFVTRPWKHFNTSVRRLWRCQNLSHSWHWQNVSLARVSHSTLWSLYRERERENVRAVFATEGGEVLLQ